MDNFQDYIITSNDRASTDTINKFTVQLNDKFKNVYSCQLLSVIVPNLGGVASEPFIRMNITTNSNSNKWRPVEDSIGSLNTNSGNQTSYIIQPLSNNTTDAFINTTILTSDLIIFSSQYQIIPQLTFSLTDCFGSVFNFGGVANSITKTNTITIVLRLYFDPNAKQ
jgi:hypothetical protein